VEDNYDLVIRVDPSLDERLVGRCVLEDERLLVAVPGRALVWHAEGEAGDPVRAAVGHVAMSTDIVWRITTPEGERIVRPHFNLRFSSFLMVRDAVLAGVGLALMPKLLVADDLATGRLVCWGVDAGPKVQIWALQNSRRLSSTRVRAFLEALASIS
jgi:DNA-binding transcriptional LysR family regulator